MDVAAAAASGGDGGVRWCCAEKSEEGDGHGESEGGARGSAWQRWRRPGRRGCRQSGRRWHRHVPACVGHALGVLLVGGKW